MSGVTTHQPRVSVLLPCYNAQAYVAEAVESVLAQSWRDFELIIIDDGSTDGSGGVLRSLAQSDSRVRLVSRANTGLVRALNELLELARAPLVARMDADDVALPERLARQVAFMEANPGVVCVGGGVEFIDERGVTVHRPAPVRGDAALQREALEGRTPICHPAAMFRTEAARAVGGYRAGAYPAEDLDLWLRLGEIGALDNVPETVLRYRLHSASISFTRSRLQLQKMKDVCEEAWRRRGIDGVFHHAPGSHHCRATIHETLTATGAMGSPAARAMVYASGLGGAGEARSA